MWVVIFSLDALFALRQWGIRPLTHNPPPQTPSLSLSSEFRKTPKETVQKKRAETFIVRLTLISYFLAMLGQKRVSSQITISDLWLVNLVLWHNLNASFAFAVEKVIEFDWQRGLPISCLYTNQIATSTRATWTFNSQILHLVHKITHFHFSWTSFFHLQIYS